MTHTMITRARIDQLLQQPANMIDQWDVYVDYWEILSQKQRTCVIEKLQALTHPTDVLHIKEPYLQKIKQLH